MADMIVYRADLISWRMDIGCDCQFDERRNMFEPHAVTWGIDRSSWDLAECISCGAVAQRVDIYADVYGHTKEGLL